MQMMHEKQTKLRVAAKVNWSRSVWAEQRAKLRRPCKDAASLEFPLTHHHRSPLAEILLVSWWSLMTFSWFSDLAINPRPRIEWQTGGQNLETCEKLTWEGDQCQKNSNHTNCKTQIQIQYTQIQKYKSHKGVPVPQFWNRQGHISAEWENAINKKRNRCHKYKTRSQPENICGNPLKNHTQTRSKNNEKFRNSKKRWNSLHH